MPYGIRVNEIKIKKLDLVFVKIIVSIFILSIIYFFLFNHNL